MKVYAIIVTYNGERWLDRCFESLRRSSVPLHTIVVDNCSSDNTRERLKTDFPEVQLIENPQNAGFGQANNIAMRAALQEDADYVLLLNQDAWIFPDTVSHLLDYAVSHSDCGILSPVHIDASESRLDRSFEYYTRCSGVEISARTSFDPLRVGQTRIKVPFVNAAAWMLPASTLNTVGGFDPIFFHYGEDNNYAHRIAFHSLSTDVVPSAFAVHDRADVLDKNDNACRWFRSYLLVEYCNINHSLPCIIAHTFLPTLKMIFSIFFGGRIKRENALFGIKNFVRSLSRIPSSRRQDKTHGPTYLSR